LFLRANRLRCAEESSDHRRPEHHDWKSTTPVLKKILEENGLFAVEVITAPADNESLKSFNPNFKGYALVVLNYNDFGPKNAGDWPEKTQLAFLDYVKGGGGVVSYHAADNAFPKWVEFNKVIGLAAERPQRKDGPYIAGATAKWSAILPPASAAATVLATRSRSTCAT